MHIARTTFVATSYQLQNELSNEKRFKKAVVAGVQEVRNGLGDGLFTVRVPFTPPRALSLTRQAVISRLALAKPLYILKNETHH